MKAKVISIETWLPIFPGFYGTIFESDTEGELCSQNQERDLSLPEIEYDDLDFDNSAYETEVVKQCTSFIEDQLKPLGLVTAIKFQGISSPKEYNFHNDSGNIEVDLTKANIKAIKAYIYAHRKEYEEYLVRYKSCSGFISYYNHDFDSWKEYTDNFMNYSEKAHYLGSILEFICLNEGWDSEVMYDSLEVYVSNYCQDRTRQMKCEDCGEWYEIEESPEHKEYNKIVATQTALCKEATGKEPLDIKSFEECYPEFSFKCSDCK